MFGFKNKGTYDYFIVGLGNPGIKYEKTRHNAGFICVDKIAEKYGGDFNKMKEKAYVADVKIGDSRCLLIKPQTFMNSSGESVAPLMRFYKVPADRVIVIFDDISFDVGKLRIKRNGSAGGHNGMKSIIEQTGSQDFMRIKVGVGKKPHPDYDLADWVLSKFSDEDYKKITAVSETAEMAASTIIKSGIDSAMNKYSR